MGSVVCQVGEGRPSEKQEDGLHWILVGDQGWVSEGVVIGEVD